MPGEEPLDPRHRGHEGVRKVGVGGRADDHEQSDAMAHYRVTLVRSVANAPIMGERDPATFANCLKPHLVGSLRREMIDVPLDRQTCRPEDLRETDAEVTVREVNKIQAARS